MAKSWRNKARNCVRIVKRLFHSLHELHGGEGVLSFLMEWNVLVGGVFPGVCEKFQMT